MINKYITGDNHVLRYCTPSRIENGLPMPEAFKLKNTEKFLSVNWVEFYCKNYQQAVQKIRKEFKNKNYDLSKNGLFVMLHVSKTKKFIGQMNLGCSLEFKKEPRLDSPSHAGIYGYKSDDKKILAALALISKSCCIFPTI